MALRGGDRQNEAIDYCDLECALAGPLLVPATVAAYEKPAGDWLRVPLKSTAPVMIRLSAWAVGDNETDLSSSRYVGHSILKIGRALVIMVPLQFYILQSLCLDPRRILKNPAVLHCARRQDQISNERTPSTVAWNGDTYNVSGDLSRCLLLRQLMIKKNNAWILCPGVSVPYIAISYTTQHFRVDTDGVLEHMAQLMTAKASYEA